MVSQGRTTSNLPVKTTLFDNSDRVVVLYGASTNNTSNSVAQTATITVTNLFKGVGSLEIPIVTSDPANSTAMTIAKGTMFATANYLYIAIDNNKLGRIALDSSF